MTIHTATFQRNLSICLIVCFSVCAYSAEPLDHGASVYAFVDKSCEPAFKDLKDQFKETLAKKEISWKHKKSKDGSYLSLAENYEKDLLKADADRYILALGLNDLWDTRKDTATSTTVEAWLSAVETVLSKLKQAEKQVLICSPYQIYEGTNNAASQRLEQAQAGLQALCAKHGVAYCNLFSAFNAELAKHEPAKRGKGICTKDGIKLDDLGIQIISKQIGRSLSLSGSVLSRTLQKGDSIILLAPFKNGKPLADLSLALKDHFQEWGVEAPRATDVQYTRELLAKDEQGTISKMTSSRGDVIFLYPPVILHGDERDDECLNNGVYKEKLAAILKAARAEVDAEIFVCTNLVWWEKDGTLNPEGPAYKICAQWAAQTRQAAEAHGYPVVDFYQACLNYIADGSDIKKGFAGRIQKQGNKEKVDPINYGPAKIVIAKEIAKVIHFPYDPAQQ